MTQNEVEKIVDIVKLLTLTTLVPRVQLGTRTMEGLWCGRKKLFVTFSIDTMIQEREFKLWGKRLLFKWMYRERVDD